MCHHCLTSTGGCIHCRERNMAEQEAGGRTTSLLTNEDRQRLGIFQKPWRGVACHHPQVKRERREPLRPRVILNNAFAGLCLPA